MLLLQVLLVIGTAIFAPPEVLLRMPSKFQQEVELYCRMSLPSFMACLAYDLVVILSCAVQAFLTRKLPENFKESWYIFISVSTTCFMWLVFLPTYFTTVYAHHQVALLAFCLFANGACTLLCLFVPKVYAVYFIAEENMIISTLYTTKPSQVGPSSG